MDKEKLYMLDSDRLPSWVKYPQGFIALAQNGSVNFPPWEFLKTEDSLSLGRQLKERYDREFFPIAWLEGTDDFACLMRESAEKIIKVNCSTTPGHEILAEYKSFWLWLHSVLEDMENHGSK